MATAAVTEDDVKLYDRQIRLWGLEAQAQLQGAQLLVVNMGALAAELCKNLVLAGIGGLTIMDDAVITEDALCAQFLIDAADVGTKTRAEASFNRLRELNPRVQLAVVPGRLSDKADEFFARFNAVCLTQATTEEIARVDAVCRARNIAFFAGSIYGFVGYLFNDIGRHEYIPNPKDKSAAPAGEVVKMVEEYMPFERVWQHKIGPLAGRKLERFPRACFSVQMLQRFQDRHGRLPAVETLDADVAALQTVRAEYAAFHNLPQTVVPDAELAQLARGARAELAPVAAVVGGEMAQEVLKVVTGKELPFNNHFFFDGITCAGQVEALGLADR